MCFNLVRTSSSPRTHHHSLSGPQLLPPLHHSLSSHHLSLGTLREFMRQYNCASSASHGVIRIWNVSSSSQKSQLKKILRPGSSFILRVTLPNIMHSAVRITSSPGLNEPLRVMTVACTGFNEVVSTFQEPCPTSIPRWY